MDHILLQLRVEHESSAKHCDRGIARLMRSADGDASRVVLALVAIASLAFLFLSLSPFSVAGSPSSSTLLSARLVAVVGRIFTSKKTALFVLSNAIFVLLAADYRCRFATTASTTSHAASSGEPGGVLQEKQALLHRQMQVEVEQCAVLSSVPCSESLDDHNDEQEGEDESTMSVNTLPDEEQLPKLELVRLGEGEEDGSITLELEETVVDAEEEPTCEAAQWLDRLEISELNKKFDEFIRSRRIKWVNEEAYLLLYEV